MNSKLAHYNLFLVSLLFYLVGCASVPNEVKQQISDQRLAGYWATPKGSWNKESYVKITCDGTIKYRIQDYALVLKDNQDEGKIKEIIDGQITFASWLGPKWTDPYTAPVIESDGCWAIHYKGMKLMSEGPIDCSLPEKSLVELLSDAANSKANRCIK